MKNPISKRNIIIITAIILVVFISTITVFILKTTNKKEISNTNSKVLSAEEVLKSFKIKKLSGDDYKKQTDTQSMLQYKSSNETLGVNVDTKTSTIYSTSNSKNSKDTSEVQTEATKFMKDNGFSTSETKIRNADLLMQYKTYENDATVCQFISTDTPASDSQSHFHQLSCVSKKSISDQYNAIKKLLSIKDSPKSPSDYMLATVINNSKDNIKYSILSLNSSSSHQSLLYAAIDDNWEYLGDTLAGGQENATAKGSITPELQAKINDAKYKGFLKENIAK